MNRLVVTETNHGGFYKATLNDVSINCQDLFKILGIEGLKGYRLGHYVEIFKTNSLEHCEVEIWEMDVD